LLKKDKKIIKNKWVISDKMDKELQKLIDERQELIDKLCMEIVEVEEGIIKIPVEV